jgi:hypothetical protein
VHGSPAINPQYIGYGIGAVIILIIMAFRFRGAGKAQRLMLTPLLIRPAILVVFALVFLVVAPPTNPITIGIMAACLAVGAVIGWIRGRFVTIEVHPETHALTSTTPIFAVILLVLLLFARFGVKILLFPSVNQTSPEALQLNAEFILFAVGAIGVTSLEMWFRARRLLAEARAKGQTITA